MPDSTPIGNDGEALRDAALNILRAQRHALIRACTVAAIRVVFERAEVCADDVRARVAIPPGVSPTLVGCVFRDLALAGILRRVGFRNTTRAVAHARPLSFWNLADAHAAVARLNELTATTD